jgi:hypothetical protein
MSACILRSGAQLLITILENVCGTNGVYHAFASNVSWDVASVISLAAGLELDAS